MPVKPESTRAKRKHGDGTAENSSLEEEVLNEPLQILRDLLAQRRKEIEHASIDAIRKMNDDLVSSDSVDYSLNPVNAYGVDCEIVSYKGTHPIKTILYLHGGGYVFGSSSSRREFAARLSEATGAPVLLVDYRLAPEYPFPAALEDAITSYRWLVQTVDPSHITVAGDSAGAGLALALLVALRDRRVSLPSACVCLSPWTDLTCTSPSMERNADIDPLVRKHKLLQWAHLYLNDVDPRNPLASPLFADLSELPRLLIQVGSAEVLLDDSTRLSRCATAAGVDVTIEMWPEMVHNWQIFASMLPENQVLTQRQEAIDHIRRFLSQ